jgi:hypothetical protein
MNSFRRDFNEVNYLIELAIEGSISLEQSRLLNQWIVNDRLFAAIIVSIFN